MRRTARTTTSRTGTPTWGWSSTWQATRAAASRAPGPWSSGTRTPPSARPCRRFVPEGSCLGSAGACEEDGESRDRPTSNPFSRGRPDRNGMAVVPASPLPQPRLWRSMLFAALAVAALVGVAVPIAANHVQTENGRTVVFDHKAGNEWWVETTLAGADAATVSKVEAMDSNGPWTLLPKQSWGAYAASFHIEP